jgi:hypothetical protein
MRTDLGRKKKGKLLPKPTKPTTVHKSKKVDEQIENSSIGSKEDVVVDRGVYDGRIGNSQENGSKSKNPNNGGAKMRNKSKRRFSSVSLRKLDNKRTTIGFTRRNTRKLHK